MSNYLVLAQECVELEAKLAEKKAELVKELSGSASASAPAKKSTKERKPVERQHPSLKKVIQDILAKHPEGLDLSGVTEQVKALINEGKYASKAKKVHTVVSQALNNLKGENAIVHNREQQRYTLAQTA